MAAVEPSPVVAIAIAAYENAGYAVTIVDSHNLTVKDKATAGATEIEFTSITPGG